ncbi:MAG TPA: PadR family transcriptional regulator [Bacillales bacterium]|nr:PadR family transcriptional regulator [Bacillales bacterium]
MSLRYAILGLLSEQDASGYELTQRFKETMIHFWHAHHTQIYRELAKMEQEELVGHRDVHQDDHPDKKVYSITDEGFLALLKWLTEGEIAPPKLKDGRLLKISLFHLISADKAIAQLEKSKKDHKETLKSMKEWKKHYSSEFLENQIGEYLTLEYGIRSMTTWIEWSDWAIGILKKKKFAEKEKTKS